MKKLFSYRQAIRKYSRNDFLISAKKCRSFLEISKDLKIKYAVIGLLTDRLGIRKEVRSTFEENRKQNPRLKNYTKQQILELSLTCRALEKMGEKLGLTRERVRQISNLFQIHSQVLKNLKSNR